MNSWAKLGLFAAGVAIGVAAVKLLDTEKAKELCDKAVVTVKDTADNVKNTITSKFAREDVMETIIIDGEEIAEDFIEDIE